MSSEVEVLKLTTGEEVIGRLGFKGDYYQVTNPLVAVQVPSQSGQVGLAFVPWIMAGNTDEVLIPFSQVIAKVSAKRQIADMYLEQVTGLSLATTDTSSIKL